MAGKLPRGQRRARNAATHSPASKMRRKITGKSITSEAADIGAKAAARRRARQPVPKPKGK